MKNFLIDFVKNPSLDKFSTICNCIDTTIFVDKGSIKEVHFTIDKKDKLEEIKYNLNEKLDDKKKKVECTILEL